MEMGFASIKKKKVQQSLFETFFLYSSLRPLVRRQVSQQSIYYYKRIILHVVFMYSGDPFCIKFVQYMLYNMKKLQKILLM